MLRIEIILIKFFVYILPDLQRLIQFDVWYFGHSSGSPIHWSICRMPLNSHNDYFHWIQCAIQFRLPYNGTKRWVPQNWWYHGQYCSIRISMRIVWLFSICLALLSVHGIYVFPHFHSQWKPPPPLYRIHVSTPRHVDRNRIWPTLAIQSVVKMSVYLHHLHNELYHSWVVQMQYHHFRWPDAKKPNDDSIRL